MPTVRLPLNTRFKSNLYTRVSIQDWKTVRDKPWCRHNRGYAINNERGLLHRVVLGLPKGDPRQADHIDRDRLNNTRSNLRIATPAQNSQNRDSKPGSSSRFRGVGWDKNRQRWIAYGRANGRIVSLGRYDDEEQAALIAQEWRQENMPYSIT